MGLPAEKQISASYADYAAVPPHRRAVIINGTLHVFPRPALPHIYTSSTLTMEIGSPFARGRGGPGGWWILDEPELHLVHEQPINPDIAGWRRERMPTMPSAKFIALPPDWACEVLSPSTEKVDRDEKMPVFAEHGVRHAWLIDPVKRVLEAYTLEGKRWSKPLVHRGDARARVAPFEAVELDLSVLWTDAATLPDDES